MPAARSCSSVSCLWVCDAGWSTQLQASATWVTMPMSLSESMNLMDASRPPFIPKVITPHGEGPSNCFFTSLLYFEPGRPAKFTHATFFWVLSHFAILRALSAWRRILKCRLSRPRFTRKALNGEGIDPKSRMRWAVHFVI